MGRGWSAATALQAVCAAVHASPAGRHHCQRAVAARPVSRHLPRARLCWLRCDGKHHRVHLRAHPVAPALPPRHFLLYTPLSQRSCSPPACSLRIIGVPDPFLQQPVPARASPRPARLRTLPTATRMQCQRPRSCSSSPASRQYQRRRARGSLRTHL